MAELTKESKKLKQIQGIVLNCLAFLVTESLEIEGLKDRIVHISWPSGSNPPSPGSIMEMTVMDPGETDQLETLSVTQSQVIAPKSPAVKLPIGPGATLKSHLNDEAVLVDVRSPGEFERGHLPGAINLPVQQLHKQIQTQASNKAEPIIVYCQTGHRSGLAAKLLKLFGYTTVINIGGLNDFKGTLVK